MPQVCQPVLPSLGPQSLEACIWSLGVQHPEGTPHPSQHLLKQLASCLSRHLQPTASTMTPAAGVPATEEAGGAAVPVAPEPPLSSLQVVSVISVLARLGVGEHAEGLPSLVCSALEVSI